VERGRRIVIVLLFSGERWMNLAFIPRPTRKKRDKTKIGSHATTAVAWA